jgi:hypothetical protein
MTRRAACVSAAELPTERQVQRAILRMAGSCFRDVFIHHSPNGTKLAGSQRDRQVAGGILKGDGTKTGFPDLVFIWRGGIAFIEVKRPKSGRLTDEQKAVHETLRALGWPVVTVTSADEAYRFLDYCGAPRSGELIGAAA